MKILIILTIINISTQILLSTKIDIIKYIDLNSSLSLTISKTDNKTQKTSNETKILENNSVTFNKLIVWVKTNTDNWKSTPASYISKIVVHQGNFRLLYNKTSVVIGFTDTSGKSKQYSKTVKNGELDFLVN